MKNRNINAEKDRLNDLFAKIAVIQDTNLKTHWAKYLAIQVSGFLETSLRELLVDYAKRVGHRNIASFVEHELENRTNFKMEKLAQLLGSFNRQWETEIKATTEFSVYKEALDKIVDARNKIAHGKYVNIPFIYVNGYYKDILKLLDLIEQLTTQ
jgi:hypothetical protein